MNTQPSEPQSRRLWSLTDPSGDQLTCETRLTEAGLHLCFSSSAGVLRVSSPLELSDVDSWSRVWRAYYLTTGWAQSGAVPRRESGPDVARTACPATMPPPTGAILRCWTMPAPDGSTVACDLVRTGAGLEVRCDALPKRAQLVRNMAEGLELAKAWRSALREPKANVNAR